MKVLYRVLAVLYFALIAWVAPAQAGNLEGVFSVVVYNNYSSELTFGSKQNNMPYIIPAHSNMSIDLPIKLSGKKIAQFYLAVNDVFLADKMIAKFERVPLDEQHLIQDETHEGHLMIVNNHGAQLYLNDGTVYTAIFYRSPA